MLADLFEVFKIFVGPLIGIVGIVFSLYLSSRRVSIEAQRVHLDRLREQVVEPMLKVLKERKLRYSEDEKLGYKPDIQDIYPPEETEFSQLLYKDLVENHYPTLQDQFKSYVEKTEDLRKKKERRDEKAIELVEGDLKRDGLQYERDAAKISKEKIVYSGGLATWLLYFMKHRKWIEGSGVRVIREDRLYRVKAGDFGLYSTDDEGEAEKVKVQLERIIFDYADEEELKLMLKECDEADQEKEEEREKLIEYLGTLREKTKLKIVKQCPYVESDP